MAPPSSKMSAAARRSRKTSFRNVLGSIASRVFGPRHRKRKSGSRSARDDSTTNGVTWPASSTTSASPPSASPPSSTSSATGQTVIHRTTGSVATRRPKQEVKSMKRPPCEDEVAVKRTKVAVGDVSNAASTSLVTATHDSSADRPADCDSRRSNDTLVGVQDVLLQPPDTRRVLRARRRHQRPGRAARRHSRRQRAPLDVSESSYRSYNAPSRQPYQQQIDRALLYMRQLVDEQFETREDARRTERALQSSQVVVFVDLDNWRCFFDRLPYYVPPEVFIWGFHGGTARYFEPMYSATFRALRRAAMVRINPHAGAEKNAADFVMATEAGYAHKVTALAAHFVIVSGDRGMSVIQRTLARKGRRVLLANPHQQSNDELYALLHGLFDHVTRLTAHHHTSHHTAYHTARHTAALK